MQNNISSEVVIKKEKSNHPESIKLLSELSFELSARYYAGGKDLSPEEIETNKSCFVIAWLDKEAVGCGELRQLNDNIGEVKKMFVKIKMRGKGISRKILNELEESAKNFMFEKIHLETGVLQPESISLYEKEGYVRIKSYGIHENNPLSICFEKTL